MAKTLQEAIIEGYAITSRKYRMAARIDREDWQEYMAKQHAPWDPKGQGMDWVNCLGLRSAADHYRRSHSKDQIVVPESWMKQIHKSNDGPMDFRHRLYNNSGKAEQRQILAKLLTLTHSPDMIV